MVVEDFIEIIEVDLNQHFEDLDGDVLTYSVVVTNDIATIEIEDNLLAISAIENLFGYTDVTITADDNINRDTCETTFNLSIEAINDSPVIISFSPGELSFVIIEEQEVDFEVIAEDIDSPLEYTWFVNQENVNNPDSTYSYNFVENGVFEIKCVVNDEEYELETIWNITVYMTGIIDIDLIPIETKLVGNFPNPFNPSTTIRYDLCEPGFVKIAIFNIKGQLVKSLVNQTQNAGTKSTIWNGLDNSGNSISSGVYFYYLYFNDKAHSMKKCIMLK